MVLLSPKKRIRQGFLGCHFAGLWWHLAVQHPWYFVSWIEPAGAVVVSLYWIILAAACRQKTGLKNLPIITTFVVKGDVS